jgi:tRNA nucleotidyltransferase (CCA-adding enzyme)
VRDLLLNKPSLDIDLVVEGDAIALGQAMQARYGGHIHSHQRFGTANWLTDGSVPGVDRLDFVTARTEFYRHPTALPEVEQSSIKQDLHRRDFTINTLAICLNPDRLGQLLDFYGGHHDLHQRRIRVLHSLSFVEDPTRILRAIRFEQRLDFTLGERTEEHLKDARDLLARMTAARIFSELEYIFKEALPEKALIRLDNLGILQVIQPELHVSPQFATQCQMLRSGLVDTPWQNTQPESIHYLGLLTFDLSTTQVEVFSHTLRLRADLARTLKHIQAIKQALPALEAAHHPSEIDALLHKYSEEALLICWIVLTNPVIRDKLLNFSRHLRHLKPVIDGSYLIEQFKLKPSPQFQTILTRLRQAKLDGQVTTLTEEHAWVAAYLQKL